MFEELLAKIGAGLKRHGFPYMIIGGQAVLLYGEPRLTRDIDVTMGVNVDRLDEVLTIVKGLSLTPVPEHIESFVKQTMVLPSVDEGTGIRVDFIFSFTPYEIEAIKRAREVTLRGHGVCFASPEDVIIHKIFSGRPRDLEDVRSIVLKNPGIDTHYITNWLKEFDKATDQNVFLEAFETLLKEIQD